MMEKIIFLNLIVFLIVLTKVSTNPLPEHAKIRIHVPVPHKHHTHFHTKTLIKTVHVPIKEHIPVPVHVPIKHHSIIEEDDDHEEVWEKSYSQKKKKYHPFL